MCAHVGVLMSLKCQSEGGGALIFITNELRRNGSHYDAISMIGKHGCHEKRGD